MGKYVATYNLHKEGYYERIINANSPEEAKRKAENYARIPANLRNMVIEIDHCGTWKYGVDSIEIG